MSLFIPVIGVPRSMLSVVILTVWYLLIGRRLVRLTGRSGQSPK